MAYLKTGEPAPDFALYNSRHEARTLRDFRGRTVILYFYPKDDTPGCTREACDFRDHAPEFAQLNAVIVGVSKDTETSHEHFVSKYGLPFELLADPSTEVLKKYGVLEEKTVEGKIRVGTARTTFLIDPRGRVQKVYAGVQAAVHVAEVLRDLKQAQPVS